jgi:hypothetical protein
MSLKSHKSYSMKSIVILFSLSLMLLACKKEELSSLAEVLDFSADSISLTGIALEKVDIDSKNQIISLLFNRFLPEDSFPVSFTSNLVISEGATSVPPSGQKVVFNIKDEGFKYTITAEDGSKKDYYVLLRDTQLPNSGFENWYLTAGMDGVSYKEPGKSKYTTIWATANYGTSMYKQYCTQPLIQDENTLVKIITGVAGPIPVTAGTIFTGRFDINGAINNPSDPSQATIMGIPFCWRPSGIKFKYSYQPGDHYIRATLKNPNNIFGGFTIEDIPGGDSLTFYATLEIHDGSIVTEIGRAEFYSGEIQSTLIPVTANFNYTSALSPTHISVVFSSSKHGEEFTGAVGSLLIIDDIELLYSE